MNRSMEQTLLALMPSHSPNVPRQLTDLATSLVAQSRQRASALKPDEEIARVYCCAHLACDRLKIVLNLPSIEPRPPIPPRVYKRLYTHLDNALPKTTFMRSSTSTTRARPSAAPPIPSPMPPRGVKRANATAPMIGRIPQKNQTPALLGGIKKAVADKGKATSPLPRWMVPVARYLCVKSDHRYMAPSIFGALDHIVARGGKRTEDPWVMNNLTAVVMAVFVLVVDRGAYLLSSTTVTGSTPHVPGIHEIPSSLTPSPKTRRLAVDFCLRARQDLAESLPERPDWEGWSVPTAKSLAVGLEKVSENPEWMEADWMRSVGEVVQRLVEAQERVRSGREKAAQTSGLVQRSDTMMQARWDFLSEERRREQRGWEENMLMKISQLEMATGAMEVDI